MDKAFFTSMAVFFLTSDLKTLYLKSKLKHKNGGNSEFRDELNLNFTFIADILPSVGHR